MKSLPLRELLRHPTTVKRLTAAGESVQVTDNGKPLWLVRSATAPSLEDADRQLVDDELDAMLAERCSPVSAAQWVVDSRMGLSYFHFRIAPRSTSYYKPVMQTLILRIPDNLAHEIEAEARDSRLTKSEVARRRLIAGGAQSPRSTSGFELIADLIGTVEGGPVDMSSRKKHYLKAQGYGTSRCPR